MQKFAAAWIHQVRDHDEAGFDPLTIVTRQSSWLELSVSYDVARPDNLRAPIVGQVRMVNETPMVPGLERLEEIIADETRVSN